MSASMPNTPAKSGNAPNAAPAHIYPCVVTVNVDVETEDAKAAGQAGLFGRYSYGRYGAREGIWRILNVLHEADVAATFFINADDAQRHPALVDAILEGGHEVAAQGVLVSDKQPKGPARLEELARAREILTSLTGKAPRGWRSSNGLLTTAAMFEISRLGYQYESSFQDDDLPYVFDAGENRRLVELPVWDYLTDATIYANRHSHERVRKIWFEEFDALYNAGAYTHLTLHSRGDTGSGRTVRANVVRDFLRYVQQRPGAVFHRCDELAEQVARQAVAIEPIPQER